MRTPSDSPLLRLKAARPCLILDGGLATALEAREHDLVDSLWTARLLRDDPDAIRDAHFDYLRAGADVIITASYQASLPGFAARGWSESEAIDLFNGATRLAIEARDRFQADHPDRPRPLVAASVGPYGAYLADGAEYRGRYGLPASVLTDFHRPRWEILAASGADLLACETLPDAQEVAVLARLLADSPHTWAWLSFSCRDGSSLCDGTPLAEVLRALPDLPNLAAVGLNCTAPEHVESLLGIIREDGRYPAICYPNLGSGYDAVSKSWSAQPSTDAWLDLATRWPAAGAVAVGGCCQVNPVLISALRDRLLS